MLTCAKSGRKFRPTKGQGWYQAAPHRPGTTLQMKVVHPSIEWEPRDWLDRGPEYGCCGVLDRI
jgi:hypothetical protein